MFDELRRWPEKLEDGRELGHDFYTREKGKLPTNISKIAFVGMGGSGIAGRIIKTFLDRRSKIPSFIISSPYVPSYIDASTLAIVISYSGNTWETVSVLEQLSVAFVPTVVIAHGGRAAAIAEEKNLPFILLPESKTPRSALGEFLGVLFGLFDRLGIMEGERKLDAFRKVLECFLTKFDEKSYFSPFIEFVSNHDIFHVWGCSDDSDSAAYRATTQFNENSKVQAVFSPFTEACHNLLVGFSTITSVPVILFSTDFIRPPLEAALESVAQVLKKRGISLYKPPILGDTWEEQVFHIILWADYASCYLAQERGVEVPPVAIIDELKEVHKAKGIL